MTQNPFKPTAGKRPPTLIGRDYVLEDFQEALDNGAGAPGRLMLISGNRGYGKTVLLGEIKNLALAQGWDVITETAAPGVANRLISALDEKPNRLQSLSISPTISVPGMASVSPGGATVNTSEAEAHTLREAINTHLKNKKPGEGILFAIDEAQGGLADDMVTLGTTIQLVIGDQDSPNVPDSKKKGVAFVFASLPSHIDEMLNNNVLTFLRRAQKEELTEVFLPDVRDAYIDTVRAAGKNISEATALAAATEAEGHPYLIQLVGYYMWREADRRGSDAVEESDVIKGKQNALLAFYDAVCAPVYFGLRSPNRLFIEAMAKDEGLFSSVADIQKRCKKSAAWVAKYRANLIRERIIESVGYGQVRFVVPHLGEYIRQKIFYHPLP